VGILSRAKKNEEAERLREVMREAWDVLIRPYHPPSVEPTKEESDAMLRYLDALDPRMEGW
jgi:hypothetical protein